MRSSASFMKQTLVNLAAGLALLSSTAAIADTAVRIPDKCAFSTRGGSLCGRVSSALYVCVQEKPCGLSSDPKRSPENGVMRLLRRLFI